MVENVNMTFCGKKKKMVRVYSKEECVKENEFFVHLSVFYLFWLGENWNIFTTLFPRICGH